MCAQQTRRPNHSATCAACCFQPNPALALVNTDDVSLQEARTYLADRKTLSLFLCSCTTPTTTATSGRQLWIQRAGALSFFSQLDSPCAEQLRLQLHSNK